MTAQAKNALFMTTNKHEENLSTARRELQTRSRSSINKNDL